MLPAATPLIARLERWGHARATGQVSVPLFVAGVIVAEKIIPWGERVRWLVDPALFLPGIALLLVPHTLPVLT